MSRILLADDSPQALHLGEQILSAHGWDVVTVTDGSIALDRIRDFHPDVFITDLHLPVKNGFEFARLMKADPALADIALIIAASPSDSYDEQEAREAGAAAILRKPFEASSLIATVQELLEKRVQARHRANVHAFDRSTIRAAVTLALDAAMPALIDELTDRVLLILKSS